jgi:hypothetical protein
LEVPVSGKDYRDDGEVQTAVRNVLVASAPERETELAQLWQQLAPSFRLMQDIHKGNRFIMDAGSYRGGIRFNHRAVRAFWVASYAAWEGFRASNETWPLIDFTRLAMLLEAFDTVISSDSPANEPLPAGVAEPGAFPDGEADAQGRVAAELATLAVGWVLLHEVHHIQHQQAGTSASSGDRRKRHQEELSCDLYATQFLLEELEAYAQSHNENVSKVRQKRQLGIYFGLFALTLLTKNRWDACETHPSVQSRINAVRTAMAAQASDTADAVAHQAFAALRTLWPKAPSPF